MDEPLIVTLGLAPDDQQWFDDLRTAHFPSERNHLGAHVTLFHQLPSDQLPTVEDTLRASAGRAAFAVEVVGPQQLGRGVAYRLRSDELAQVHAELARAWSPWLTRQDQQGFRPHVTVQNKVTPERARGLYEQLLSAPAPATVAATGLQLWRYLGGPWEHLRLVPFAAAEA